MKNKLMVPLLVVLSLAVAGVSGIIIKSNLSESIVYSVTAIQPVKGFIFETVALNGNIEALNTAIASAAANGSISNILVEEGSAINKESTIFSMLSDDFEELPILSPISGIVGPIAVKIGENINPKTILTTVYDIQKVKSKVFIPEKYYQFIRTDLPVKVELTALPKESFDGKISKVSPVVDPEKHAIQVEVVIDNAQSRIKPGMSANVQLTTPASVEMSLKIPESALISENNQPYVLVALGNLAVQRKVVPGKKGEGWIEIVSGLSADDKVITSPLNEVKPGDRIKLAQYIPQPLPQSTATEEVKAVKPKKRQKA